MHKTSPVVDARSRYVITSSLRIGCKAAQGVSRMEKELNGIQTAQARFGHSRKAWPLKYARPQNVVGSAIESYGILRPLERL